jgi:hypothetical protein
LEFDILRVPPIQIPTKKVKILKFGKQISPSNTSDGIFGNYIGGHKPKKILGIQKCDILRVPPIQITTKKGKIVKFYQANFTLEHI